MSSVTAPAVTEKLTDLFSRYKVPREILSDQGPNFMAEILKEVYVAIRIKPIRTSPYDPQTDGLVQKYNQTLKATLR